MKTRVITATVMVAVMIPFFWFSDTILFPILMAFLSGLGVFEMQTCIGGKGAYAAWLPAVLLSAGMPFIARYLADDAMALFFLIAFCLIILTNTAAVFSGGRYAVDTAALTSSMSVYIGFGFSAMVMLRDIECGSYIFLLALIIPWMTDTFAYFSGRLFGKHKLIPAVSPKKTVEGSVGGTLFSVLLTMLYGFLVGHFFSVHPDYLGLAILSLCVSLLSQCGDLMMSLIKRKFGIKDYGRIFPGHGGVLDRFDSVVCTAPCIFFLLYFVKGLSLFTR